ncbi:unnamed protein product [Closterium sp. NIES-65]|nr:unnamed protein product [Closterium sp. NIES-65]
MGFKTAAALLVAAILIGTPPSLPRRLIATGADQAAATAVVPAKVRVGAVVLVGSLVPTFSLRFLSVFALLPMGANAAAKEVVPAKVRVGTVVLVGSLAQPNYVDFDWARCVSVPQGASASIDGGASGGAGAGVVRRSGAGGSSGGGGGAGDAVVWWDVFGGGDRTVCNAVQLFVSPNCSGAVAANFKYTGEYLFRVSKINASVKSIRVEFLIYSKAPPTCPSPPPVRVTTKISPSVKSIRCVLDNICSRVKCPAHSTSIKTKDDQEVTFESTQS